MRESDFLSTLGEVISDVLPRSILATTMTREAALTTVVTHVQLYHPTSTSSRISNDGGSGGFLVGDYTRARLAGERTGEGYTWGSRVSRATTHTGDQHNGSRGRPDHWYWLSRMHSSTAPSSCIPTRDEGVERCGGSDGTRGAVAEP